MPSADDGTPDQPTFSTGYQPTGQMKARFTEPAESIAPYGYLTPEADFSDVERGNPLPYTLPLAKRRAVGLERETWRLEVTADPDSDARIEQPLAAESETAIDFQTPAGSWPAAWRPVHERRHLQ
ncbi:MAG: hypothetical protein U0821_26420 [Chloroflexota bacterium]